ncbi:excalibur calcium-binding domain-containing protein [Noviherbaspirillum massiliense]
MFRREGKRYCSEMNSCGEAKFYLNNCSGAGMNRDRDGVPYELQLCRW